MAMWDFCLIRSWLYISKTPVIKICFIVFFERFSRNGIIDIKGTNTSKALAAYYQ